MAVLMILLMMVFVALWVWLAILIPAGMAERRNRSVLGWVILSLTISPPIAIIALLVLGMANPVPEQDDPRGS